MKILHIINSFEGGGAEKLMLHLHTISLQNGVESHAVSLMSSSAGNLQNTYTLNFKSPYEISVIFKLYSFLAQNQWKNLDILHVHLFPAQLYTPIVIKALKLKPVLVTTEHSTSNTRRNTWYGKLIDNYFYSYYNQILCISFGTSESLLNLKPQLANKISVIYNGIDIKKYSTNYPYYSKKEIPIIISVGRLVIAKNYETAIRALSKISSSNFEYWIVGCGTLELSLKRLVNYLNLGDKVKFLGFRQDIPELLQQADIFLHTSIWEGFGLAVVEAMAAGLPVIVSDVPGVREVILSESTQSSEVGFLVDPLSEENIATSLTKLLEEPKLRIKMGNEARIRATHFDIDTTFRNYINLYHELCKNAN